MGKNTEFRIQPQCRHEAIVIVNPIQLQFLV